jgi:RNase P subunit RPR2
MGSGERGRDLGADAFVIVDESGGLTFVLFVEALLSGSERHPERVEMLDTINTSSSSDHTRRQSCGRCGTPMMEVATVAPFAHEPGLIAYECCECGHVMSVVQMALHPHGNR